jgi:hydrogenase-4 membrane subunit HyfE
MKKKLMSLGLLVSSVFMFVSLVVPSFVSAQTPPTTVTDTCATISATNPLQGFLCKVALLLNTAIPVLITLGVVYFIYGVISYAIARDESAKTGGRDAMVWGLIALMVIVSVWGLVNFIKRFVGVNVNDNTIAVPCIESPGIDCP